jgi:RNA polymerase sigma-70 factor (sigma-E family)
MASRIVPPRGATRQRGRPAATVEVLLDRTPDAGVEPEGEVDRDTAFTAFVAEHSPGLLRTAWFLCGDRHRAEELVQHTLVRTYASWDRAQETDPVGYARRVLVNLRTDTWRRRVREVLTAPDELPDDIGGDPTRTTDDRDALVRALATLPARQRATVVLRHMVGMSEAEVAHDLGVSVGTVKSATSRGLAALRASLSGTPWTGAGR